MPSHPALLTDSDSDSDPDSDADQWPGLPAWTKMAPMQQIDVSGGIRLGQFLKLVNAVEQGSEVKQLLASGVVRVNGQLEQRRGRQLAAGDLVTVGGQEFTLS